MTLLNPLIDYDGLPRFSAIDPDHVGSAVVESIAAHREAMKACTSSTDFAGVFRARERADAMLSRTWQMVSHLAMVADTPELRAAHMQAQPIMAAYTTAVEQDLGLFDAIGALPRDELTPQECRAIDLALRDFELSGIALDSAARACFVELTVRLGQLSTDFSNAVLDATEAWTLHLTDDRRLGGIGPADLAMLAMQAREKGLDGWLIDLNDASLRAILHYADDRELRRTVYEAYNTRASDVGPDANRFDNGARMTEILRLRSEAAELLGFETPVAWSLAVKMARDAAEVEAFLLDLAARARPGAQAELAQLTAFAAERLALVDVGPWDIGYLSEKLRIERHSIDHAVIKRHLPVPGVLSGLFGLIDELYGVEVRPQEDVDVWHPDVCYFAFYRDGCEIPFAGVYCDLFARLGKKGGAWVSAGRPRSVREGVIETPIAFLNCNFGRATEGEPAYVSHDEMVTLFHEMGHCLHYVLTETDLPSVGGFSGVEWDAVELPSQFMENFAWEPAMLRRVSAQAETGARLPDAMIDRMIGARQFLGGMALLRQIELSLFDIRLHLAAANLKSAAVMDILQSVRAEVAVVRPPEWNRFAHGFNHIFAGGYAAGYYSYLWAELLSADAFEPFAQEGADRPALGNAFRQQILSRGGTRTANDNFVAFRGREPKIGALLRARGLTQ